MFDVNFPLSKLIHNKIEKIRESISLFIVNFLDQRNLKLLNLALSSLIID